MILAEFLERHIDIGHNLSINKQVQGNVLEIDSLIVPFDHVLKNNADHPVEPVLDLRQVFLVLFRTLLGFLKLLFPCFLIASGLLERVLQGVFLVDD